MWTVDLPAKNENEGKGGRKMRWTRQWRDDETRETRANPCKEAEEETTRLSSKSNLFSPEDEWIDSKVQEQIDGKCE